MSDHCALIELAREHTRCCDIAPIVPCQTPACLLCGESSPCLPARLGEALEQAEAAAAAMKSAIEALDQSISQQEDADGFIDLYLLPPGRWHELLGFARGVEPGKAFLARLAAAERERDAAQQAAATEAALHGMARAERDDYQDLYRRSLNERQDLTDALKAVRAATDLALPSEQTGPEWEQCVRVPVARMAAIDAAITAVFGEPAITNEPKPALHAAAITAPQEEGQ